MNPSRVESSTIVYVAYLLEEIEKVLRMAVPCAHCDSYIGYGSCCSLQNNIRCLLFLCFRGRELIVALTRLSLSLGNRYKMRDEEFSTLLKSLGLTCRKGYFEELQHVIIKKINISFSINIFENFVATHSILIHLGHSPFAGHCSVCRLQKRI